MEKMNCADFICTCVTKPYLKGKNFKQFFSKSMNKTSTPENTPYLVESFENLSYNAAVVIQL